MSQIGHDRPVGVAKVNPVALETLEKHGVSRPEARSKSWDEFAAPGAPEIDFIFTVCASAAGEACPIWLGHPTTAHWGIADPAHVEPMEARREAFEVAYLFFTGKGGVGKTSLSCATGLALAEAGKRVLIVSTDPASNLDEVLETPLSNAPTAIRGVAGLFALNIDPEAAAAAYREPNGSTSAKAAI